MPNSIEHAKIYQTTLDQIAIEELKTGWMDANAGQVIYNGGDEVKVPQMSLDGLAAYSRTNGYAAGSVNLEYKTLQMTQDRGRKFSIDAMDVDETNFTATAAAVLGTFQSEKVIPEIDAYRLATLFAIAAAKSHTNDYTPAAADVVAHLKQDLKLAKKNGVKDPVVHISYDAKAALETALGSQLRDTTWSVNGVDTRVPSFDGAPLIETPDERMHTSITISDSDGYTGVGEINWLIIDAHDAIAVNKTEVPRIFTPEQNQDADAWIITYRKYHDMWVKDNRKRGVVASRKPAVYEYNEVTPASGDNPKAKGWYELSGTDYVLTTDTSVNAQHTYYERVEV